MHRITCYVVLILSEWPTSIHIGGVCLYAGFDKLASKHLPIQHDVEKLKRSQCCSKTIVRPQLYRECYEYVMSEETGWFS